MLTVDHFNLLREDEKAEIAWSGTFLTEREQDDVIVQLYSLPDLYIELFYDPAANKILRFQAFTSRDLLAPYLAKIKFN